MQKGETIRGYKVQSISLNISRNQDKNIHEIIFRTPAGTSVIAHELNVNPTSAFKEGEIIPFVVLSVGSGNKPAWIKADDTAVISAPAQANDKEFVYISRESMKMSVDLHVQHYGASVLDSMPSIVELAQQIGKSILDNAKALREYVGTVND